MDFKTCKQCGKTKQLEDFPKSKTCKDGRRGTCKECKKEYLKKYHIENRDHIKKTAKEYYERNKQLKPNNRYQDIEKKIRCCIKCEQVKNFEKFPKCKKSDNGYTWVCKECTKSRKDKWAIDNKEHVMYQRKLYKEKNKDKIAKQNREYDLKNKERRAYTKKQWQENNKEYCRKQAKIYRNKNRERRYQYELKYKSENQDKIRKRRIANRNHHNKYIRYKKNNDINFKIACALRARFKVFLKSKGVKPNIKTLDLIGCSLEYFKKHIEK